ncbi:MBL fold metallo-hydrolase [Acutalibacter sp. 1XD8-33]|uniref:MBL fold metallo-hydrolase n=1 Tax=Acutalibacter sp. 1XD8-33 TaxID=2320081 RepID=UPI000EA29517|nr:MBL fold metallo-hydrolase [Acutalibacter sp. 1XD8-33]RKJ39010.1 MBL fold metallo-hydrolase [Acutalibacter sp. 1XD8-33]
MARLCPLFSGSSGNSYYIGSREAGVLIDAGRSARQLDGMLRLCGIDPLAIQGVLVTHEHSDHISGLRVFARKYGLPVYATEGTLSAAGGQLEGVDLRPVGDGLSLGDMEIRPFPVSHDCVQPVGYRIRTGDGRHFCLATDLGYLSPEAQEALLGCDMVVIESNHDVETLRSGPYPYHLKRRILSDHGHLSNGACAAFLPQLLKSGVRRFLLAHLSRENNSPQMALSAALSALTQAGYVRDVDFLLDAAPVENSAGKTVIF